MEILIGGLFAFLGVYSIYQEIHKRLNCKELTKGTVVDFFEKRRIKKGREKISRYPIFEYVANGNTIREQYNIISKARPYSLSDEVELYYNPNKENEFYIKGDGDSIVFGVILLLFGVLVLSTLFL